jgi:hypothetical protein
MRLDEFLKTRIVEIVVHSLDMTDALGDPPIATLEGVSTTVTVLEGLLAHNRLPSSAGPSLISSAKERAASL